jgi:hypothetical protein
MVAPHGGFSANPNEQLGAVDGEELCGRSEIPTPRAVLSVAPRLRVNH